MRRWYFWTTIVAVLREARFTSGMLWENGLAKRNIILVKDKM